MKIIVLSDSHGDTQALLTAVAREQPDLIIHLGDFIQDCAVLEQMYPQIPLRKVAGNCDGYSDGILKQVFDWGGRRIFMTHGHRYHVKLGEEYLIQTAREAGANLVLYGHTHSAVYREEGRMVIINPGSIGYGAKTYGVVTLEDGKVSISARSVK